MIKTLPISIHLPKCAGTSLQQALLSSLGDDVFLDYGNLITNLSDNAHKKRLEKKRQIINRLLSENFNYKLIHGHFYATKYLDIVESPSWITLLRHPVELVNSYYNFLRRSELNGPLMKVAKEMDSLESFAEHPWFRNIMSRQISPLGPQDFSVIATMERYDDFLLEVSRIMGVNIPNVEKNVSKGGASKITEKQIEVIEKHNALDISLYDSVSNKGGLIVNT